MRRALPTVSQAHAAFPVTAARVFIVQVILHLQQRWMQSLHLDLTSALLGTAEDTSSVGLAIPQSRVGARQEVFLPRSGFWECLCPQHPKSMSFSASWLHAGALRSRKVKLPCLQRFSCSLPHSRHCRVKRLLFVSAAWLLRHTGVKSKLLG